MTMTKASQDAMLKQLKNPFEERFVKWRVGATSGDKKSGIALAYIDSREVQKRLDDVCGLGGWQARYTPMEKGFICELDIWLGDRWVTKSNAADFTKVSPVKGGASDALKRAAATWGIGRYLYYLPNQWVAIKPKGQSYELVDTPPLPKWAKHGAVENWEDVAELEAVTNSGADETDDFANAVATVDSILNAETIEDLDMRVDALEDDQKVLLANQIMMKRRSLEHGSKIHTNNS